MTGETKELSSDLAQLARLAISEQAEDVRLFVARLVRKYRNAEPGLAEQMDLYLRTKSSHVRPPLRKVSPPPMAHPVIAVTLRRGRMAHYV